MCWVPRMLSLKGQWQVATPSNGVMGSVRPWLSLRTMMSCGWRLIFRAGTHFGEGMLNAQYLTPETDLKRSLVGGLGVRAGSIESNGGPFRAATVM